MKNTSLSLKRLSLIIGILGLLVLGGGLVLASQASQKELSELLQIAGLVVTGMGGAGLVIAWRESLYGFSQSRQARYGANAVILSLSFVGIVVLLNYLAYRHDVKWDLTENQSFTLSDQTQKVLTGLKNDVKVKAFYRASNSQRQQVLNRLESYRDLAKEKFKFEMIDPERQPGITLQYGVTSDGMMILESGTARKELLNNSEEEITSALISLTRTHKPKIYFVTGHNELDPEGFDPRMGLSSFKLALEQENYSVAKLPLLNATEIPADTAALVIAGPEKAFSAQERQLIQDYLDKKHGKVLVMLPPRTQSGLESMLGRYGVELGNNIVVDPGQNIQGDASTPAFNEFTAHAITKDLSQTAVFLPLARSVQFASKADSLQGVELFKTTAASWGETNLAENSKAQKDSVDPAGPLSMAVAVNLGKADETGNSSTPAKPKGRLVVVGNAIFAANWFWRQLGNADFVMNSIAWLTESEDLISIRTKPNTDRSLTLTGSQETIVAGLSLYGMPGLMLVLGIFVWWRRR